MRVFLSLARQQLDRAIRGHPFLRLLHHFMGRTTGAASTSDLELGLAGALALLALPGAFISVLLLDKYSSLLAWLRGRPQFDPYRVCLPDEYFFLVFSMAITGLIVLLRWDKLLPDTRDFANLAPLPLSLWQIFLANVAALAGLAALFAFDVNAASAVIFPLLVTSQTGKFPALWEFLWAHAGAVLGISLFTFFALLAAQGWMMALLPAGVYRKVALLFRMVLLVVFVANLISVLVVPLPLMPRQSASGHFLHWWPPVWFLSWFESHIGALRARSPLGPGAATRGLGGALLLAAIGFAMSYRRYFLKIPERQSGFSKSHSGRAVVRWVPELFALLVRPGRETACFQFMLRTLLRSELHLLLLGLWAGIGLLLTLLGSRSEETAGLTAPLTFALFSLSGLRFIFEIPGAAQANWPFRLLASNGSRAVRGACRKLMMLAAGAPLLMVWFPIAIRQSGLLAAMIYLILHAAVLAVAVELLLWKNRKIPFTCLFRPQRDRLLQLVVGVLLAVLMVLPLVARLETAAAASLLVFVLFLSGLVWAWVWLHLHSVADSEPLLYEDDDGGTFALLRLGAE